MMLAVTLSQSAGVHIIALGLQVGPQFPLCILNRCVKVVMDFLYCSGLFDLNAADFDFTRECNLWFIHRFQLGNMYCRLWYTVLYTLVDEVCDSRFIHPAQLLSP